MESLVQATHFSNVGANLLFDQFFSWNLYENEEFFAGGGVGVCVPSSLWTTTGTRKSGEGKSAKWLIRAAQERYQNMYRELGQVNVLAYIVGAFILTRERSFFSVFCSVQMDT